MKLPNDTWYNYTNFKILREFQKINVHTWHIDIYLTCFDSFEFMTNLEPQFGKSILVAKHWPKVNQNDEWSFYYDEYIKTDTKLLDKYHKKMSDMKSTFREYLHKYYNPEYVIDRDLTIIKTMRDLLDSKSITYNLKKPTKKEYMPNECDWFDTGSHDNLIWSHPHAYVLGDI